MLTDAHIHFHDLAERDPGFLARYAAGPYLACAASHDEGEFLETESWGDRAGFISSFGIHPQWPVWKNADFLALVAGEGRIKAIGEAGFDFFGDRADRVRNEENDKAQTGVFEYQLDLAERLGLPLLVHLRKATDKAFLYSRRLARLPGVVFHSWPGTAREAGDLLARGVPGFFSFGTGLLKGHKKAIESCAVLPLDRLLSETDAPWQPLQGQSYCRLEDLPLVVAAMARLRDLPCPELEAVLEANFHRAYLLSRGESDTSGLARLPGTASIGEGLSGSDEEHG